MCGIVVFYEPASIVSEESLSRATTALHPRGPDASGYCVLNDGHVGMGATRLSLVDLDKRSNQPFFRDGFCIVFNGEVYNFNLIRDELKGLGWNFLTTSDTEVVLCSYIQWGVECLKKFRGGFAFSIFNPKENKLFIARDIFGEKQLVFTKTAGGSYFFASEVKALACHPEVTLSPDIDSFSDYLVFELFSDPERTFFKNISFFPSGSYMEIDLRKSTSPKMTTYWSDRTIALRNVSEDERGDLPRKVVSLLRDSVAMQMHADAPVGSILSGGLDSSLISILASEISDHPVRCFTAQYEDFVSKDLRNAQLVAKKHPNISLEYAAIPKIGSLETAREVTYAFETPLLDLVNIAQHFLYLSAAQGGLKAVLNGQCSDEIWLGYYHVDELFSLERRYHSPQGLREYWWESFYFSDLPMGKPSEERFNAIIDGHLSKYFDFNMDGEFIDFVSRYFFRTYLQGQLRCEDRISMGVSVEVRLPYLYQELIELGLSLSYREKVLDGREKYLLRQGARGVVPPAILRRKKLPFPSPSAELYLSKLFNVDDISKSTLLQELFSLSSTELKSLYHSLNADRKMALCSYWLFEKTFF